MSALGSLLKQKGAEMYAVICRQCRGPGGRAQPNAADLDRAGPSRTDSSDGTSVFAVAPASCDAHFKRGGKCRLCAYFAQSRSKGGAPFGVSELISNSSAGVGIGSGLLPQVRFRA